MGLTIDNQKMQTAANGTADFVGGVGSNTVKEDIKKIISKMTIKKYIKKIADVMVKHYGLYSYILFFGVFLIIGVKDRILLNSEKVQTVAIVYDFTTIRRSYVVYEFVVNGKKYNGKTRYSPKHETFSIGDTIPIFYQNQIPIIMFPFGNMS